MTSQSDAGAGPESTVGAGRSGLVDAGPADVIVRGGQLVNVFTEEIYPAEVAIAGERAAGLSTTDRTAGGDDERYRGIYRRDAPSGAAPVSLTSRLRSAPRTSRPAISAP